ncbi:paraneoplastic antigen Ma1 homolog [Clarias gariepinus]|uniref:paraneoplastic antigen Ma1 homolog n=1 Tax=Clarias gariepinus TaxID=13013 RepID=UPI00234D12C1|nr:paraneoplastic antigen Ma1 homolog [Clarias gariepinus]
MFDGIAVSATLIRTDCASKTRMLQFVNFSNDRRREDNALCADPVPSEIQSPAQKEPWLLITLFAKASEPSKFSTRLQDFLRAEQRTLGDLQALMGHAGSSPESIIRAMGEIFEKTVKSPAESSGYRRLRVFSGVSPTPAGEEQFEHWLGQARLMVEESDSSAKEKRRRIMESLKGPALEIVPAARLVNANIGPDECLKALESAFGMVESGEDLYFSFRLMQQRQRGPLSDFLQRLEQTLAKVIRKGGISAAEANRVRLEQLIRGAVSSNLMVIQLRLRERKKNPPDFLELLSEIREEEEYETSRSRLNTSVRTVSTDLSNEGQMKDIQALKKEIK